MRTPVDAAFREEAARYHLAFACTACASFDAPRGSCSLGYPNQDHVDPSLEGRADVVFCKAFELW